MHVMAMVLLLSGVLADGPPSEYRQFLPIAARPPCEVVWALETDSVVVQQGTVEVARATVDNAWGVSEWRLTTLTYPWDARIDVEYRAFLPAATNYPLVPVVGDDWSQGWRARQTGGVSLEHSGTVAEVIIRPEPGGAEKIIRVWATGDTDVSEPAAFSTRLCVQRCLGDHNGDCVRDTLDVWKVIVVMEGGGYYLCYDANADGELTQADVEYWASLWGLPCDS